MHIITPSKSFTRPADTSIYASGDLLANSTTAGSVVPMSFAISGIGRSGIIRRARLHKSGTTVTQASFKVHLYDESPTVTNGDNGAFQVTIDPASWIGTIPVDLTSDAEIGATAGAIGSSAGVVLGVNEPTTSSLIYGLIEVTGTYNPASAEVFTVKLDIEG